MRERFRLPRNGGERVLRQRDQELAQEHLARDWVRGVNGARDCVDGPRGERRPSQTGLVRCTRKRVPRPGGTTNKLVAVTPTFID